MKKSSTSAYFKKNSINHPLVPADPQSKISRRQFSIFNSQFSIFNFQFSIFNFQFLILLFLLPTTLLSQEIQWLDDVIELEGPGKYSRMVLMKQGPKAGQILLTYQEYDHGRVIVKRYSSDGGKTWSAKSNVLKKNTDWTYANCNIIELKDGRLLMTYQKRVDNNQYTGRDRYVCVKYSTDGGETWSAEEEVFQGGNWEPMPIETDHGIYIFFTLQDIYPTWLAEDECLQSNELGGRCVAFVASYDNGSTWTNWSNQRYGARMILRDYNEDKAANNYSGSGGGMPTPFVTADGRIGFIAESIERKTSPWIVVAPEGDHDFDSFHFQGTWQSVDYDGTNNNNVYPLSTTVRWALTTREWGGAPFALNLPNGKIAFSYNHNKRIYCWVADSYAKNPVEVARPFGDRSSFYSAMINLNDSMILITAYQYDPSMEKIFFRQGKIPKNPDSAISDVSTEQYIVGNNTNGIFVKGLKGCETITVYYANGIPVQSFSGNAGEISIPLNRTGLYIIRITDETGKITSQKILFKTGN